MAGNFNFINDRKKRVEAHRIEAVAQLLSEGESIRSIAQKLGCSTRTVDKDLANIRAGLGAQAI